MFVLKDSEGFTLIEFLVSVLILTVGLLGLLQAINLAVSTNLGNKMRDEATVLADETLSSRIAQLSTTDTQLFEEGEKKLNIPRKILSGYKNYSVSRSEKFIKNPSDQRSVEINVEVVWRHKGSRYTHNASTVVSKR